MEMFPDSSRENISACLDVHGTVARAALSLSTILTNNDNDSDSELAEPAFPPRPASLPSVLEELKAGMSNDREKLKVDEEDLLNDAIAYYKDPHFDPKKKLRVIYNKQPAADTGGVTRQFFTQLLNLISEEFFHGDTFKIPIYNSNMVVSGIMKHVGTIIVHSILQGGPGFPVFSPSVYYYLATGDLDASVQKISVNDCSIPTKHFIDMVSR